MTDRLMVEVSAGELLDKITILEIKAARIADPAKHANVAQELSALREAASALVESPGLEALIRDLKSVNEALWEIEDEIRACEAAGAFGARFIELARSVYVTNDRRAALKREINLLVGSRIVEEKQYTPYEARSQRSGGES
ncbi:MAG: DUF6165 family protein [Pseudomonadota bacterium]